jgi:hypothetical protein
VLKSLQPAQQLILIVRQLEDAVKAMTALALSVFRVQCLTCHGGR